MNGNEQLNFQIESFIGTVITRSFIENQILDSLKMFDLSNFNEKEFSVLEDFIMKFKKGKLKTCRIAGKLMIFKYSIITQTENETQIKS